MVGKLPTDTLFQVAQKRFQRGTIKKDELLELELNLNNAMIKVEDTKMQYRKNKEVFITFLSLPQDVKLNIVLPEAMDLTIPGNEALELDMERNSKVLEQHIKLLEAKRDVARTRAENRFQANLNISYGFNKADGHYDYINDTPVNGKIR